MTTNDINNDPTVDNRADGGHHGPETAEASQPESVAGETAEAHAAQPEPPAGETAEADAAQPEPPAGETAEAGEPADAELEAARREAEENYNRYLRAQADFDNFRRRSRQEKEEFAKYASLKLIEQLLPIVDNFERALGSSRETSDFESLVKGLDMTSRQINQVLEAEGLKPMETVGQPFNPDYHQAIMQVQSEEHEEGTIVEEVQKGYMLKDKVLRPAMVKVSG